MDEKPGIETSSLSALAATIKWLEDEQHRLKAQALRLQQQLEQVYTATTNLEDKFSAVDESLGVANIQAGRIGRVEEEVRQALELLHRLREAHTADASRLNDIDRMRQTEAERERHERLEMQHKIGSIEKIAEAIQKRVEAIDETYRRQQEGVFQMYQRMEKLDKQLEALVANISIEAERGRRQEQAIADLGHEVEAARKQGEINSNRLQLLADQMRRMEEASNAVMAEEGLRRDMAERLESQRFNLQRLERVLAERQQEMEEFRERQEAHTRLLAQADSKINASSEGIGELKERLLEQQQSVDEQISAWFKIEEQQKRRQLNELEQQIRDLRNHASRPSREAQP